MTLKFSKNLDLLLKKLSNQSLTLQEVAAETSEQGFSLVIFLLALPFLFPMPPGLTSILGLGCFFLGLQMALGRRSPWLPRKIAQFRFPRNFLKQLLKNVHKITRILEKITRTRWSKIAKNPYSWKSSGFCIAWLAVLLMLPIPFTNPIPTIGILLLAVATLEADGLLICIGYGLTILITLFFLFMGYALWQAPELLPQLFS